MKKPKFNLSSIRDAKDTRYDGWANSATAMFALYVNNDRAVYEKAQELKGDAIQLGLHLMRAPIKIDSWTEGKVWLHEVVVNIIEAK